VFSLLGAGGVRLAAKQAGFGGAALIALALLPGGEKIIDLLPWIGSADTGSTSYRKDLFDSVAPLLLENPIFGLPDYDARPELQHLRQGEQIIDLVNSYIGVGVSSGLVGLFFFVTAHATVVIGVRRAMSRLSGDEFELVRGFLAAYATGLMTIATVSSISAISPILWVFCGVGSAIVSVVRAREYATRTPPESRRKGFRRPPLLGDDELMSAPR
jgi:O-antigen ligase